MPGIRIDYRETEAVNLGGGDREMRVITDSDRSPGMPVAMARYRYRPLVTGPRHRHDVETEVYYCLGGSGTVTVGDTVFSISTGVVICIPPGNDHHTSSGEDGLEFLAFFTPPIRF